jgi:tRNA(Arg) A34 adenosine deaminase TadA
MKLISRRTLLAVLVNIVAVTGTRLAAWGAVLEEHKRRFVEAAFAMKDQAECSGDQAYGAVVVRGAAIIGWGPSRVIANRDWTAHAEQEAIRDAQATLGADLAGCVLYSTSRPCVNCERAAAEAGIARMFFGAGATDAGVPRRS